MDLAEVPACLQVLLQQLLLLLLRANRHSSCLLSITRQQSTQLAVPALYLRHCDIHLFRKPDFDECNLCG
jgi:hypothetical protein